MDTKYQLGTKPEFVGASSPSLAGGIKKVAVATGNAADKFLGYSAKGSSALLQRKDLPWYIIHPLHPLYRAWWHLAVMVALITAWIQPYSIAFSVSAGLWPYDDALSIVQYVLMVLIAMDIVLSFFVARYVEGELITEPRRIAMNYVRGMFAIDIISLIPFEVIAVCIAGYCHGPDSTTVMYLNLLRVTYMLRCYRIAWFFSFLSYDLSINLIFVTLLKNFTLIFFAQHIFACAFYFIARVNGFPPDSWVTATAAAFEVTDVMEWSLWDRYVYSMYWSIATFATVGYGDIHAYTVAECICTIVYIYVSVFLMAYVIGTTTMVIMKNDERMGQYRERVKALNDFSKTNYLPLDLRDSMLSHLKLHFINEQAHDEAVLRFFPSSIRRRVLRHLYMPDLDACYLLRATKQRFRDALLNQARVELYLPHVEILLEGDMVSDLLVVAHGELEVTSSTAAIPQNVAAMLTRGEDVRLDMTELQGDGSVSGGSRGKGMAALSRSVIGEGACFGEIAFLTGSVQLETVRTLTPCRVLAVPRAAYRQVAESFPDSARQVLHNLLGRVEELASHSFGGQDAQTAYEEALASASKSNGDAASNLPPDLQLQQRSSTLAPQAMGGLTMRQHNVMSALHRVRVVVKEFVQSHDEQRVASFLSAASHGNNEVLRRMMDHGVSPDVADYDGRTALMLASMKGFGNTVELLLKAGADTNLVDGFGGTALWEAVKHRQEAIIKLLVDSGARLKKNQVEQAKLLCSAVADSDLGLLHLLLKAKVDANAGDYDSRTALHIAAAEGNLPAAQMLIDKGHAKPTSVDRWGHTPLDEARRANAVAVASLIEDVIAGVARTRAQLVVGSWLNRKSSRFGKTKLPARHGEADKGGTGGSPQDSGAVQDDPGRGPSGRPQEEEKEQEAADEPQDNNQDKKPGAEPRSSGSPSQPGVAPGPASDPEQGALDHPGQGPGQGRDSASPGQNPG